MKLRCRADRYLIDHSHCRGKQHPEHHYDGDPPGPRQRRPVGSSRLLRVGQAATCPSN
jgi:hypothetical protein